MKSVIYRQLATAIHNNKAATMKLSNLERLCTMLHCTPNDVMEWIPDDKDNPAEDHPLNELKRNNKVFDITRTLNSIPLSQLDRIEKAINDELENMKKE